MTVQTKEMTKTGAVTRRGFLVGSTAAGTGLIMGFSVLPNLVGGAREALAAGNYEAGLFITMEPSGITTVHITKAEIGQHVGTTLAQVVAEELEVDWNDVRIDYPDSHAKWGLMITGGSWSVNWTFDAMSRAGASGRIALVEAGAAMLDVAADECRAENSQVIHDGSGGSVSYADIVSRGNISRTFSDDDLTAIELKQFGEYSIVGTSVAQLDIPAKSDGTAGFGIDVFVPNMVYGKLVEYPTRWGAMPLAVEDSAAKSIPGYLKTLIIEDPAGKVQKGYAVVIAESYPAALEAATTVEVEWDKGPNTEVSTESILAHAQALQSDPNAGLPWVIDGDTGAALESAEATHEAAYITDFAYHGVQEPMNCTAFESLSGVWHLYTGTQWQTLHGAMVAGALGVDAEKVVVHQQYLGGGFGRRLTGEDAMVTAALAAKAMGRPVKLIYSREDDMQLDFHRSPSYQVMRAGTDANGAITAIEHDVVSGWVTKRDAPGFMPDSVDGAGKIDQFAMNGSDHWYSVPNQSIRAIDNDLVMRAAPPGYLRSVAPGWTFWALESFVDEIAHKFDRDPVEFRLSMLDATGKNAGSAPNSVGGAERLANVLRVATDRAGWNNNSLPANTGMGVACTNAQDRGAPSWTACVAEVAVDPGSGEINLKKLTLAVDIGTVVNPDGVLAQIEGASLWGVSLTLFEKITMKDGKIEQSNYDTWMPLRMNQVPEVDITLIENGHYPVGIGEPAVTVVGPAIANAIFDAVGARVRTMPITPEAVKEAMS